MENKILFLVKNGFLYVIIESTQNNIDLII